MSMNEAVEIIKQQVSAGSGAEKGIVGLEQLRDALEVVAKNIENNQNPIQKDVKDAAETCVQIFEDFSRRVEAQRQEAHDETAAPSLVPIGNLSINAQSIESLQPGKVRKVIQLSCTLFTILKVISFSSFVRPIFLHHPALKGRTNKSFSWTHATV